MFLTDGQTKKITEIVTCSISLTNNFEQYFLRVWSSERNNVPTAHNTDLIYLNCSVISPLKVKSYNALIRKHLK